MVGRLRGRRGYGARVAYVGLGFGCRAPNRRRSVFLVGRLRGRRGYGAPGREPGGLWGWGPCREQAPVGRLLPPRGWVRRRLAALAGWIDGSGGFVGSAVAVGWARVRAGLGCRWGWRIGWSRRVEGRFSCLGGAPPHDGDTSTGFSAHQDRGCRRGTRGQHGGVVTVGGSCIPGLHIHRHATKHSL